MHVPEGIDIVGGWFFTLAGDARPAGDLLDQLARTLVNAGRVLEEADLLHPQQVSLQAWRSGTTQELRPLPDMSVPVPRGWNDQWIKDVIRSASAAGGFPDAIPRHITLAGPGDYLDADGTRHSDPQLCELHVWDNATDITAFFAVRSDVWLPYNLAAQPQQAIAARNAPRLSKALADLREVLGVLSQPSTASRHAQVFPDGLDNIYDIDGEVMATYPFTV